MTLALHIKKIHKDKIKRLKKTAIWHLEAFILCIKLKYDYVYTSVHVAYTEQCQETKYIDATVVF